MPNQFKTRIHALDAKECLRRWVELEADREGITMTILRPVQDGDFEVIQFIIGYLISGIGAYDKTVQDLIYSIAKQIVEKFEKERM